MKQSILKLSRAAAILVAAVTIPLASFAQTSLSFSVSEVSGSEDEVIVNVWTSVSPSTLGSATIDVLYEDASAGPATPLCPSPQNTDLSLTGQFNPCFNACLAQTANPAGCAGGCSAITNSYSTFSCDNPGTGVARITITPNTNMGDIIPVSVPNTGGAGDYNVNHQIVGLQVGSSEGTASSVARLRFTAPVALAKVQVLSSYETDPNSLSIGFFQSTNNEGGEDVIEDDCDETQGGGGCTFVDTSLPVELAQFGAIIEEEDVVLNWVTASELNNAGFSIEHARGDSEEFAELAYVDGHGTTDEEQVYSFRASGLDIGLHKFRLRQIDFDGAFEYSEVVEAMIELAGTHRLGAAYPNPFNPSTTFELVVGRNQQVQIDIINALGQRVQRLFTGVMEANEPKNFVFDAQLMPTGLYFYRVVGENFAETKQMLLVK